MGVYLPGGANTPRSKASVQKGGGVGLFDMGLTPRAPRLVKKAGKLKRPQQRMDKWLDDTIVNQDQNMWSFPTAFFKRAANKVGVLRMSKICEPELRYELSETTRSMVRDTLIYADHARAKVISTKYVKQMLKLNGLAVWMPPLKMRNSD